MTTLLPSRQGLHHVQPSCRSENDGNTFVNGGVSTGVRHISAVWQFETNNPSTVRTSASPIRVMVSTASWLAVTEEETLFSPPVSAPTTNGACHAWSENAKSLRKLTTSSMSVSDRKPTVVVTSALRVILV